MLNILNREVQKRLFSEARPELLIAFLNQCFFQKAEKVVSVIWTDDLAHSYVHVHSCFQDTISCKIETSEKKQWIVEIDVVRIHKGKDTSFIKLRDKYFDAVMKTRDAYAYQLPLLYIGLFTFDIGTLKAHYYFPQSEKNYPITFQLLNIEAWNLPQETELSPIEQWMYLFKSSMDFSAFPDVIKDKHIKQVAPLLEASNWEAEDLEYYHKKEQQWEERNERVLKMYRELESLLIDRYLMTPATKVNVSIIPLSHQLAQQSLKVSIDLLKKTECQKMAFDAFRKWLKETHEKYPKFNIIIKDEGLLVQDFKNAFSKALKSLMLSEKFYTHFKDGWDVGYVLGYLTGSLSVHWHHEYVIKQTNDFKLLTALQALRDFLKFNDTAKIQAKDLYENFIKEQVNMTEFDTTITPEAFMYKGESIEGRKVAKEDTMIVALENIINTQIHQTTSRNKLQEVDFSLENIVPTEVVEQLIEVNKFFPS